MKIGLLGTGNMGSAIMRGYINSNPSEAKNCYAYNIHPEKAEKLAAESGLTAVYSVDELVKASELIIIAVKPYHFDDVLPLIKAAGVSGKTIMSVAAGVSIEKIEKALGEGVAVIRIMPNTPATVLEGMTSVSVNSSVSKDVLDAVMGLLCSFGKARLVDEELIHAVIGASGSSPAYTYMYIDAVARANVKEGMTYEDALYFTAQAVLGAAKMVLETGISPDDLRDAVCSPNGTTIEAVKVLQSNSFYQDIEDAVHACVEKSRSMTKG